MNRIEQLLPAIDFSQQPESTGTDSGLLQSTGDCDSPSSLFMPLHYERNYAYPLLIWLHGPRDSEQQLKRIMPLISIRNYVSIAPRGVIEHPAPKGRATQWSWPDADEHTHQVEQRVLASIASARSKSNIAPRRVFLAGFGTGGTTALRIAMRYPRRFAGVLSLCGAFPAGGNPLAQIDRARQIPLFLACGQNATQYCQDDVCSDLRLLHSAGMSVSLRVYPGGDEISPHMLSDMDRWMMELVTSGQLANAS